MGATQGLLTTQQQNDYDKQAFLERSLPKGYGAIKFLSIVALLDMGRTVLYAEMDVVLFKNPLPSLMRKSPLPSFTQEDSADGYFMAEPLVWSHDAKVPDANIGFFWIGGGRAANFMQCVLEEWCPVEDDHLARDQNFMSQLLFNPGRCPAMTTRPLDGRSFTHAWGWTKDAFRGWPSDVPSSELAVVHFNGMHSKCKQTFLDQIYSDNMTAEEFIAYSKANRAECDVNWKQSRALLALEQTPVSLMWATCSITVVVILALAISGHVKLPLCDPADLRSLWALAWPAMGGMLMEMGMCLTDQALLGHLGTAELSAAGLGNVWFNGLWLFIQGSMSWLDTWGSQAAGAGDSKALVLWTQRGILFSVVVCVLMAVGLYHTENVLQVVVRQEEAALAGIYCRGLMLGLLPYGVYSVMKRYLQVQQRMRTCMYMLAFGNLLNLGLGISFIYYSPLGSHGAAIATSICRTIMCVLAVACIVYRDGLRLFQLSSGLLEAKSWATIMQKAIAGGFQVGVEAWFFDTTTLIVASLHDTSLLGAQSILMVVSAAINFTISNGISIAVNIRVGTLLGSGDASAARRAAIAGIALGVVLNIVAGLAFTACRGGLGKMFLKDIEARAAFESATPVISFVYMQAQLHLVFGGICVALGCQHVAAILKATGFWVLGFPFAWILGRSHGLTGLWAGIGVSMIALCGSYVLVYAYCTWNGELQWWELQTQKLPKKSSTKNLPDKAISFTSQPEEEDAMLV
jgi:MATE family multidrug resistance protein